MHRFALRVMTFVAAALAAFVVPRPVAASCGSASCFLVTHSEEGVDTAGSFQLDLSYRYVDQSRKLEGSSATDEVLVPKINFEERIIEPGHHREISTRNSLLQLDLAYGITSRLGVFGVLPLLVEKDHEHVDGVGTPDEHFTNGDGTRGFGDVALGVRYALLVKADDLLMGSVSAKLPTGASKLRDGEGAINEPTIEPGSGSYDGVVSLYYAHHGFPSPVEWFVSGSGRINGRNALDYRVGREEVVSGGVSYAPRQRWVVSLQANARHAGRDDYRGLAVPSTGSRALTVSPGVRFRSGDRFELYGYVQVPVYQKVNESQLAPRAGFVVGVSRSF
jgi:hypothetical protein